MPYMAPGDAFSSAFEKHFADQATMARQAQQDQIALEREARLANYQQEELRQGAEALKQKREEFDQSQTEKRRSNFEKAVQPLPPGYIPDPDLLKEADALHMGHLFPVDPATGGRTYVGDKQEREKVDLAKKVKAITEKILTVNPGTPEYQQLATEYEMLTNKSLPKRSTAGSIRLTMNPRILKGNPYTDPATGLPATPEQINDPDTKVDRLSEPPDTSARDAANEARRATLANTAHEQAIKEVEKANAPVDATLKGIQSLGIAIGQMTPMADTLIAPLVLKATVSGTGTGFRMTRAEIENVVGGRSKWESLNAALNKWNADPSKALSITDEQRKELRQIIKAIRSKATQMSSVIMDANDEIDNAAIAGDTGTIYKARTKLKKLIASMESTDDDDSNASSSAFKPPSWAKPVGKK